MSRLLTAVLAVATLAMIGWYAYWALHQGRLIPGFTLFFLLFSFGLALPYLVALVLLAWRERDGLALAFCTALLNAVWMVPRGAFGLLFIGFTMGNIDQLHQTYALALAGFLQVALLAVTGAGLWYPRERTAGVATPRASTAWPLAVLLPFLASSASWTYFAWQQNASKARSALAANNDSAAQATMEALRKCLAGRREHGYPARLEECPDIAPRASSASGFRFEYLRALPGADGRIGAYFICAHPMEFRVTGHSTLVADASGIYLGDTSLSPLDAPPTCASVLDTERAIAFCAYERAAREPAKGYPERLADIAPCVSAQRTLPEIGADRVRNHRGERYVYLAEMPDAGGRVSRFRIHRFDLPGGSALWIDDQFRESESRISRNRPAIEGLAAVGAPERFAPGCAQGRAADCFAAGYEWDRKAHQARARGEQDLAVTPMREAAQSAFARGCELSDARSCSRLASELGSAPAAERDVVRIAALYEKACALGYADGCRDAADMYQSGRKARVQTLQQPPPVAAPKPDLRADPPRALALYGRGCELENQDACFIAARLLVAGEGIQADRGKAFTLYARLCERRFALACSRAAGLSTGQQKDYLRRACAFGESEACGPAWK